MLLLMQETGLFGGVRDSFDLFYETDLFWGTTTSFGRILRDRFGGGALGPLLAHKNQTYFARAVFLASFRPFGGLIFRRRDRSVWAQ